MKMPRGFTTYAPSGWLMAEKLDGYRARFNPDTKKFVSRQNKLYNAPTWFTEFMPDIHIDGELFCGRDGFQKMGAVRKKIPVDKEWFDIKLYAYDLPDQSGDFMERYQALVEVVEKAEQVWKQIQAAYPMFQNVTCPLVLTEHVKID